MIIYLILALTILAVAAWLLPKNNVLRISLGSIFTLLLTIAIVLLCLNMGQHFGMEKKTVTSDKQTIYTAGDTKSPAGMLIAQQLGTDSDNYVMVYRDKKQDKKPASHFVPNKKHIIDAVKKHAHYQLVADSKATVQSKSTYWVYKNDLMKSLFKMDDKDRLLIKQTTVVRIPKDTWVVATPQQVKALGAKQKQAQDPKAQQAQQAALQQQIMQQVGQYKQKNPNATPKELKNYTNQLTAKMAAKQIKSMLK